MNSIAQKTKENLFDKKGKIERILRNAKFGEWDISGDKTEFTIRYGGNGIVIMKNKEEGNTILLDVKDDEGTRLKKSLYYPNSPEGKYLEKYTDEIIAYMEDYQ